MRPPTTPKLCQVWQTVDWLKPKILWQRRCHQQHYLIPHLLTKWISSLEVRLIFPCKLHRHHFQRSCLLAVLLMLKEQNNICWCHEHTYVTAVSLQHKWNKTLVKSVYRTVPNSLFWAPTCVAGFEHVPLLACQKAIISLVVRTAGNSNSFPLICCVREGPAPPSPLSVCVRLFDRLVSC